MDGPASSCKIWRTPPFHRKVLSSSCKNESYLWWKRVGTEWLGALRYIRKKVNAKCARNTHQQRSRLKKQVLRFYKRTKIELPRQQSKEICRHLIEAIESSDIGKKELSKITTDGNKHIPVSKGGLKAGDCITEVWQKDKESYFRDQKNNGMRA